jgi:hypothetical protein
MKARSERRREVFVMIEELGRGVRVRSWASILDEKTRVQAEQTALLPILTEPIALIAVNERATTQTPALHANGNTRVTAT